MKEIIANNFKFIEWSNFIEPLVWATWVLALFFVLLFVLFSVAISNIIFRGKINYHNPEEKFSFELCSGMSIISFLLIFLGMIRMLYAWMIFPLLLILFIISYAKFRPSLIQSFLNIVAVVKKYKYIWLLFVISSLPSLLPSLWFDESSYHLAYAHTWVQKGQILSDPNMRFPLYTFNFHVLHTLGLFFQYTTFSHLLSWLCGCISFFGIIALGKRLKMTNVFIYLAAFSFFFTPVVQQYLNIAYHDVPLMCFMFFSVYALILSKNEKSLTTQIITGILCAMFVGMKPTAAFLVPFYLFFAFYKSKFQYIKVFLLVFCVLGSFWYIRNIILDGDPIPPTLNFALHKSDKFWSVADYAFQMKDIVPAHHWGWKVIYKMPIELTMPSAEYPFRYWPFLGYVFIVPFIIFFIFKDRKNVDKLILYSFAILGFIVWIYISTFTRYAHFLILAIFSVALILDETSAKIKQKWNRRIVSIGCILISAFFMFGPKLAAVSYYKNNFNKKIPLSQKSKNQFIGWGDPLVMDLICRLKSLGIPLNSRIYGTGLMRYKLFFQFEGYRLIGDAVNIYRYDDFISSLKNNQLKTFLTKADCNYLMIDKTFYDIYKEYNLESSNELIVIHNDISVVLLKLVE